MSYATFALPEWVEVRGQHATHNLAGSAAPSLSIKNLIELSSDPATTASQLDFSNLNLNYNATMTGQDALKANLGSIFGTPVVGDHILTTTGTSQANQIVLQALLRPGDHVVCIHPVYAQLYTIPRAVGADISFWRHRPAHDWQLQLHELENLIRDNTRMIIINNPSNPTGAYLDDSLQRQVITLAQKHGLVILADEIFRPLFHFASPSPSSADSEDHNGAVEKVIPKSFLDHAHSLGYSDVVVTGSMSKSYSFPGIRVGWIVCRNPSIVSACANLRLLSLMCVSPIDETIASEALSGRCRGEIIRANLETARTGRDMLEAFITSFDRRADDARYTAEWIKPQAASTTLIRFVHREGGEPLDDQKLCGAAFDRVGLLLVPASLCFDTSNPAVVAGPDDPGEMKGWIRIGFVVDGKRLSAALDALAKFLETYEEGKDEDGASVISRL